MGRNIDGQGRKPHKRPGRNTWRAYLTVGYDDDGKPIRRYVYGRTAEECRAKLDALRREYDAGRLVAGTVPDSLGVWLEAWLADKVRTVKPRTLTVYRQDIAHLPKRLLSTRLDRLTPLLLQRTLNEVADSKSPRAAKQARAVLSSAMRDAVRLGLIHSNPVAAVQTPTYKASPIRVWTAAEVMRFVQATEAGRSWYHALFYVALATGARMGELFALQWGDLDGDVLSIVRTVSGTGKDRRVGEPKTRAGNRRLPLGRDALAVLEHHRRVVGLAGLPTTADALLFPADTGGPLNHSNTRRALHMWADRAGVPRIRPHDLRHTYASMAIAGGMTPADLARQLGHADAAFTLRRYVHFFERANPRVAPTLAELAGVTESVSAPASQDMRRPS